ncbi:DUF2637 domain-containing protein [Kitasatospora sp. NPDC057015]|uniref:DUF2637 domain-containing protein n=1 Tax=Kitasatospora sp. NPDC057015 TaxID=3346001 RepID=UPI00363D5E1E
MKSRRPKVSPWDIAAVALLGAAGFALSYDALQQMAQAIHVRGQLSYLFPVVVDGFIAYGVRALVLLREAPATARAYTWSLFAGATGTSVWANALHAIRLNDQVPGQADTLRLGDLAVGSLSTIAPLALAGAVHLGIIVTRHGGQPTTAGPAEPEPTATALGTLTRQRPLHHDRGAAWEPSQTPELASATTRTAAAELSAGPDHALTQRSAEEKIRLHHQGARRRDRILARLHRQQVRTAGPSATTTRSAPPPGPAGPAGPSGPDRRSAAGPPGPQTNPAGPSVPSAPTTQATNPSGPSGPPAGPPDRSGPPDPSGPSTGLQTNPTGPSGPPNRSGPSDPSGATAPPPGPTGPSGPDRRSVAGPPGPRTNPTGPSAATARSAAGPADPTGPSGPDPQLLEIGRAAAKLAGRTSRTVVATAIRQAGHSASNERVGEILQILRTDKPPPRSH